MSVAVRVAVGAGVGVGEVSAATSGSVLSHSPADEVSAELDWSGTEDRARPHWIGLNRIRLEWTDRARPRWIGLDGTRLEWADRARPHWIELNRTRLEWTDWTGRIGLGA